LLSLFLHFDLLRLLEIELFLDILSQSVHCWFIQRLLIFTNWFCILLLCWKVFLMSRSFLVKFFRSFRHKIMSSALNFFYFFFLFYLFYYEFQEYVE
jgi:hypothetical protein